MLTPPQDVFRLPVIDWRWAHCESRNPEGQVLGRCGLIERCGEHTVLAEVGALYRPGGMMFVAEAPGQDEVVQRRPLVGRAGRVFDKIASYVGIDRAASVLTNSIICRPPGNDMEEASQAVERCNNRLFEEIHAYKPRVIVAMGGHAQRALIGKQVERVKQEPGACDHCGGQGSVQLRVAPWIKTDKTRLKQAAALPEGLDSVIGCKTCRGTGQRKKKHSVFNLQAEWSSVLDLAGAIVDIHNNKTFAHCSPAFPPETKYIVTTYHPSFLMRADKKKKGGKGDAKGVFFMPLAAHHMRRAKRLLTEDFVFPMRPFIIENDSAASIADLQQFLTPQAGTEFAVDIETAPREGEVHELVHSWLPDDIDGWVCEGCGLSDQHPAAKDPCNGQNYDDLALDPLTERLTCIGISRSDTDEVCVVDLRFVDLRGPRGQVLAAFLADPNCIKDFHNGAFDTAVLEAEYHRAGY